MSDFAETYALLIEATESLLRQRRFHDFSRILQEARLDGLEQQKVMAHALDRAFPKQKEEK